MRRTSGWVRRLIGCSPLLSVAVNATSDGFLKCSVLDRWDAAASGTFEMWVSTVSPAPICKLSRLYVTFQRVWIIQTGFINCVSKNVKGGEKEHLYSLSRIWQLSNSLGIHCHIQCHYLTWCLADYNRAQIERQCHREKGMSPRLHLPFRLLPFIAFPSLCLLFKPERNHQSHSPPPLHEVNGS